MALDGTKTLNVLDGNGCADRAKGPLYPVCPAQYGTCVRAYVLRTNTSPFAVTSSTPQATKRKLYTMQMSKFNGSDLCYRDTHPVQHNETRKSLTEYFISKDK